MKYKLPSFFVIIFYFTSVSASNAWIVATSGGNYTTISAAIAGATSGDTIYVLNTAVGNGYQGTTRIKETTNISITNKSLTIMPYYNDTLFFSQSQWTISPSAQIEVDIIGMNDSAGGAAAGQAAVIASGAAGTSGSRTTVRLLGGQLGTSNSTAAANTSGYVNFGSYDYLDLTVYNVKIFNGTANPAIQLRHGSIIGDSIVQAGNSYSVSIPTPEATLTTDTCNIIANIIYQTSTAGDYAINWTNSASSMFFSIMNNYIYTSDYNYPIYIGYPRASTAAVNRIDNNTIVCSYTSSNNIYGMYLASSGGAADSYIEVQDNFIGRTATSTGYTYYGIYNANSAATVFTNYNYIDSKFSTGATYQTYSAAGNNYSIADLAATANMGTGSITQPPVSSSTAAATSLGYYVASSPAAVCINAGNPAISWSNIDLSQNTVGCYGGSFSLTNFFPTVPASAKVWMVNYSQVQTPGSSYGFKATSFDK